MGVVSEMTSGGGQFRQLFLLQSELKYTSEGLTQFLDLMDWVEFLLPYSRYFHHSQRSMSLVLQRLQGARYVHKAASRVVYCN